jgi:hypothetical protein
VGDGRSTSRRRAAKAPLLIALVSIAWGAPAASGTPQRCDRMISRAGWVRLTPGWRLVVVPSACGRSVASTRAAAAFRQAIELAAPPRGRPSGWDPHPGSLLEQFRCHAEFAPRKPSWDLEAWRPAVPWLVEVLDLCNPP